MNETRERSHKIKIGQVILWVLVCISLAFNGLWLYGLYRGREMTLGALESARVSLARLGREPITTQVSIDQNVPINTTIPFSDTFQVPLDFNYPLSTVINTSVKIPVIGEQDISVPIEALIPIEYTLDVPIQRTVPISFSYRVQLSVPVEVAVPPETISTVESFLQQAIDFLRYGPRG